MKHLYFLATCLFVLGSSLSLFAQSSKRVPDPQNTREGEHVEYCITHNIVYLINFFTEKNKDKYKHIIEWEKLN
jgi:hypothetical protein